MVERANLRKGMLVRSQDGHGLGRVIAVEDHGFEIERGFFFLREYACSFGEIAEVRGDEIILKRGREALHRITLDERFGPHLGLGGEPGVGAPSSTGDGVPPFDHDILRVEEEAALQAAPETADVPSTGGAAGEERRPGSTSGDAGRSVSAPGGDPSRRS